MYYLGTVLLFPAPRDIFLIQGHLVVLLLLLELFLLTPNFSVLTDDFQDGTLKIKTPRHTCKAFHLNHRTSTGRKMCLICVCRPCRGSHVIYCGTE